MDRSIVMIFRQEINIEETNSSKGRFNVHFVSDQNKEIQYALNVRKFSTKKKPNKKTMKKKSNKNK